MHRMMVERFSNIDNNLFAVLDIETSRALNDDGIPTDTWLNYGVLQTYSIVNTSVKSMSVNRFIDWQQLDDELQRLSSIALSTKRRIVIYVHNLSYEYHYLTATLYSTKSVTASKPHHPMKCTFSELKGLVFKCTYVLSQMSLRLMGEVVGTPKLDSEYRYMERGEQPTEDEWRYCERDTLIPALYIQSLLKLGYKLSTLPLTMTGFVRQRYRELYDQETAVDWDLLPSEHQVELMKQAFYGGITISNPRYTGIVVKDVVSYDETSAYPFVMLSEQFPKKFGRRLRSGKKLPKRFIATIRFKRIKSKYEWAWLSVHRALMLSNSFISFNGKIIYADTATFTISDVDYKSIKMTYEWDSADVVDGYELTDDIELPKCYRDLIFEYSKNKSELKKRVSAGENLKFEYSIAKARLNSIYGMCVQKIVTDNYRVTEDGEWIKIPSSYDDTVKRYSSRNGHMGRSYVFGVYVTAYARYNLLKAIVTNCPTSFVYADTDSVKFIGNSCDFKDTNKRISDDMPESVRNMGEFEFEGRYDEFKTFGAKKYASVANGELKVTVAGLPKTIVADGIINKLEEFELGSVYKKIKLAVKYLPTGAALFPVGYRLNVTENDRIILEEYEKLRETYRDEKST